MKTYRGNPETFLVTVDGRPLDPRFDLRNHSPDGFCWGYSGSGPAQLALAILADCVGDEQAVCYYQQFKAAVISSLLMEEEFELTEERVQEVLGRLLER